MKFPVVVALLLMASTVCAGEMSDKEVLRRLQAGERSPDLSLFDIVQHRKPELANMAWERFVARTDWVESALYQQFICYDGREPYKGLAVKGMLGDPLVKDWHILGVLACLPMESEYFVPLFYRYEQLSPSNRELAQAARYLSEKGEYGERCFQKLLAQNPTVPELYSVNDGWTTNRFIAEMRQEIWYKRQLSTLDLAWMTSLKGRNSVQDGSRAWERLLALGMPDEALVEIVNREGPYQERAWEMLYVRNPSTPVLRRIIVNENLPDKFRLKVAAILCERLK